jgi:hypothetical protein
MLAPQAALDKDLRTAKRVHMQHRHFAFIAGVIAGMPSGRTEVMYQFIHALRATNPNFDPDRFTAACLSKK